MTKRADIWQGVTAGILDDSRPGDVIVGADTDYGYVMHYVGSPAPGEHYARLNAAQAARLVARVNAANRIDPAFWRHERTVYGSEAWVDNDVDGQMREIERRYDDGDRYAFRDLFKAM